MLTKKTQYAFQALIYIAQKKSNEPVLIAEIAEKKAIPLKFLENILLELRKNGILSSKKGKGGGYYFETPAKDVTLSRIIRLINGPIALLPCVSLNFYQKCPNCDETNCGFNRVMAETRDASLTILDNRTIADIANVN